MAKSDQRLTALDAERSVLGALFLDSNAAGWLPLADDDFFDPKNRAVWRAARELWEESIPIDPTTIEDRLARHGTLDAIGGLDYIAQLAIAVPTAANAGHYAEIVRRKRVNRDVLNAAGTGGHAEGLLQSGIEGAELLDELMGQLGRIDAGGGERSVVTLRTAVCAELDRIDADVARMAQAGAEEMIAEPTGVALLDRETGGMPVGHLSILAARPGVGKTTAVFRFLWSEVCRGGVSALFSYEDKADKLARTWIANMSGISRSKIRRRNLNPLELASIRNARNQLANTERMHVFECADMPTRTVARLVRSIPNLTRAAFDYIQSMPAPQGTENKRTYQIEESLRILEGAISECNIVGIGVSQLKRPSDERSEDKRPTMRDLKDSGSIEHKGKWIVALHETEELVRRGRVEWCVLKNNEDQKFVAVETAYNRETGVLQ